MSEPANPHTGATVAAIGWALQTAGTMLWLLCPHESGSSWTTTGTLTLTGLAALMLGIGLVDLGRTLAGWRRVVAVVAALLGYTDAALLLCWRMLGWPAEAEGLFWSMVVGSSLAPLAIGVAFAGISTNRAPWVRGLTALLLLAEAPSAVLSLEAITGPILPSPGWLGPVRDTLLVLAGLALGTGRHPWAQRPGVALVRDALWLRLMLMPIVFLVELLPTTPGLAAPDPTPLTSLTTASAGILLAVGVGRLPVPNATALQGVAWSAFVLAATTQAATAAASHSTSLQTALQLAEVARFMAIADAGVAGVLLLSLIQALQVLHPSMLRSLAGVGLLAISVLTFALASVGSAPETLWLVPPVVLAGLLVLLAEWCTAVELASVST